jgi:outer membrane protein OmpA-like peptidoglycan-associated protein
MNTTGWQKVAVLSGVLLGAGGYHVMAGTPSHPTKAIGAQSNTAEEFALDIKFDTNKATLQPGPHNEAEFKKLSQEISNDPNARVEIEGYADSTGLEKGNQQLSAQRAENVRAHLVSQYGISPDRVKASAYGEMKPLASNATPGGQAHNRRVIARIIREPGQGIKINNSATDPGVSKRM